MAALRGRYSTEDFAELVRRETDAVELKSGTSIQKLQEAMVAFSNTEGGVVFIGVSDDREVVGRRLDQGTDDRIHEAALAAHDIGAYTISEILVGSVAVVALEVRRREGGFAQTSDGRILVRRGARNTALFGADAAQFISARALRRFERARSGVRFTEHDRDLLAEFCAVYRFAPDDPDLQPRLAERGLMSGDELTVAGALLLTDPATSLSFTKAVVEVRRYPSDGPDYDRRVTCSGSLPNQIRTATGFIVGELGHDLIVTGLYRHELPKLPEVVVREAIANAVAHRSYENQHTAVIVELRTDRVVIRSPGGLPEPVTVRTIRQAQAARNPDVLDALRRFSLAEDAGRGVDVMEDEMEAALLDPPHFEDDGRHVIVQLPLHSPITPRERAWVNELARRGHIEGRDRLLLVHAARGQDLTNASARDVLRTADSTSARKSLHRLRDAGLLEQRGDRGGATYTLKESLAPPAAFRLTSQELAALIVEAARDRNLGNEDVRDLTGLERAQAQSLLAQLVRDGRLTRIGERRGTRYRSRP